ncbi:MAG: acyl-CoA dehydrogenase family protein [Thermodesulfobacteriota bacterium]
MDHLLSPEEKELQLLARKIARAELTPVREEYDEEEKFPWPVIQTLAKSDLFRVFIPEEYEGLSDKVIDLVLVTEELSRIDAGIALAIAGSALGSAPILMLASEEQKKKYLPEVASGKKLAAFGLTEAGAGSDAGGIRTTAKRDGDSYILNGTKQWITNGGEAETYSVIALTDKAKGPRGASAFIIEKEMPGFTFGKKEKKLGIRCSATRELVFEDCRVAKENLIGREGMGFIVAMRTLDKTRPGIGAQAVGLAQGAFEAAVAYARERHQFEKPIISFQAVLHMLADMAAQIEAARALVYAVARWVDTNPKDISKDSAISKLFPSDVAMKVTVDAVQIFGGYGFMRDYPVEKMMRDAKILQIYEGTNQIQRNVVGQALIKEYASK